MTTMATQTANTVNFVQIPGYENTYEISAQGQVRRVHKKGTYRILKPALDAKGYHRVDLSLEGKTAHYRIHILVAMAFLNYIPNGKNDIVVDHISNVKTDNNLTNLQLISHRYNSSKDASNSTGYTGVDRRKSGSYRARIEIKGTRVHIGTYGTAIEASNAYQAKLRSLNEYPNN